MAEASQAQWFGHPRGLATLFFTEMWERFSYYGMRAILILFMTAAAANGGLGWGAEKAGAIYGIYTASVYLLALPGGFLADRLFGQRRAVLYGGIFIALGNFGLALPGEQFFYLGLLFVAIGTGLLKPNVSTMVGELYPEGGARRDAGFSVFYMGINLGAFLSPLVCGYVGERINWHLSFACAGVGMLLGLVQYVLGARHLGEAGIKPHNKGNEQEQATDRSRVRKALGLVVVATAVVAALFAAGVFAVSPISLANATGAVIVGAAAAFFLYALFGAGLESAEKKRMIVIFVLFCFSAIFWSGFEQAGSSLNLFADRLSDRHIFGWDMPASWLQSVNSIFIILLAPVFGSIWVALERRKLQPSAPLKFVFGDLFVGLGFLVMMWAAQRTMGGAKVGMSWLWATYFLHTIGELCLSPVGLSFVTKLAPQRMVGQMMGIWFMSISLGNLLAGRLGGLVESLAPATLFGYVAAFSIGASVVLLLFAKPVTKMMGGVS